jgi:hypothetical protein
MAEIVNLRQARKQRALREAEREAQENRVAFGRTRAEREATQAERDKTTRRLDGHRLTDDGSETKP